MVVDTEQMPCEAEDLVRGTGKAHGSATNGEPLNRYRRYRTGDEDQLSDGDKVCYLTLQMF